jgi:spheroidene monooxygenase
VAGRETLVLALAKWQADAKGWGLARLVLGALPHRRPDGLRFERFLGSGHEGGFGLSPGWDRFGYLGLFDTEAQAHDFIDHSPQLQSYRDHADALRVLSLQAFSSRGQWGGVAIPVSAEPPEASSRMASMTRASIHWQRALAFWSKSPAAEADLAQAEGCELAVGLGEAPLVRQATFSIWSSQDAMTQYAHSGGHQAAIAAAYGERYFSESAFIRFRILRDIGQLSTAHTPA